MVLRHEAHVGVDLDSGVVHSMEASTAKVHDSQKFDDLLHGDENAVFGDRGYVSGEREKAFRARGKVWGVMRKAPSPACEPGSSIRSGC